MKGDRHMMRALIVYGSTTGNTQTTAEMIGDVLEGKGLEIVLKSVDETSVEELAWDYDLVLLGSSTWGDDEIEMQEDFAEFYEKMDEVSLDGKKLAAFGCGDKTFTHFCGAVDLIEEKVEELGGSLVIESLKIDGDPNDADEDIREWASAVSQELR
jgi:flavodoxin I